MKVRLCYIPTSWSTPSYSRGIEHSTEFNTLEDLIKVMSKCIYNGEWVEDEKGNKLDVDFKNICAK